MLLQYYLSYEGNNELEINTVSTRAGKVEDIVIETYELSQDKF